MTEKKLTPKQQLFVLEYLKDLNATQAAIRAGYNAKNADVTGPRMLGNVRIAVAIQESMNVRSKQCEIEADAVLRELARLGFSNMRNYAEWGPGGVKLKDSSELTDDMSAAVFVISETRTATGRTFRFKLHDKISALEKLGKHLKLFTDVLRMSPAEELQNMSDEELDALIRSLTSE